MRLGLIDMAGTVKLDDSNLGGQETQMRRGLKLYPQGVQTFLSGSREEGGTCETNGNKTIK